MRKKSQSGASDERLRLLKEATRRFGPLHRMPDEIRRLFSRVKGRGSTDLVLPKIEISLETFKSALRQLGESTRSKDEDERWNSILQIPEVEERMAGRQALIDKFRKRRPSMKRFWLIKGWFKFSGDQEEIVLSPGKWADREDQIDAVRFFVEKIFTKWGENKGKGLREALLELTREDLNRNMLGGMLSLHHESIYEVLNLAYPELNIKRWETKGWKAGNFFVNPARRIEAFRWLVEKTGKEPLEITRQDFMDNGLRDLLYFYPGGENVVLHAYNESYPDREK